MRKVNGLLGIAIGAFLLFHAGAIAANANSAGNNGTLKVISASDPALDMDNDPKVCDFFLAGFKFDGNSRGTWWIEGGPGAIGGSSSASGTFAADASGNWHTAVLARFANGQYKAFAKQNGTNGGDKQKVFKVECATSGSTGSTTGGSSTTSSSSTTGGSSTTTSSSSTTGGSSSTTTSSSSTTGGSTSTSSSSTTGGSTTTSTSTSTTGSTSTSTTGSTSTSTTGSTTSSTGGAVTTGTVAVSTNGGAQGEVNAPTGESAAASGVQGEMSAPAVSSLPSTSTDSTAPLAGLGAALIAFGALLLRRPRIAS